MIGLRLFLYGSGRSCYFDTAAEGRRSALVFLSSDIKHDMPATFKLDAKGRLLSKNGGTYTPVEQYAIERIPLPDWAPRKAKREAEPAQVEPGQQTTLDAAE